MKQVGLVFGGQSNERFVSQKSAQAVRKHIDKKKYKVLDIEITPDLESIQNLFNKIKHVDVAFLILHGPGGEDGKIQALLDLMGIRYTSSSALASAIVMNKTLTKKLVSIEGVRVPRAQVDYKWRGKCVVKPNNIGSSLGISVVHSQKDLRKAVNNALKYDSQVVIEEFITGREFTVPVLDKMALPVVEIVPKLNSYFDYKSKYEVGGSDEIAPAKLTKIMTRQIQNLARKVHNLLGCKGLTRSDFILHNGHFYFLEINTIPGLTEQSLAPKSAMAAGISFTKLIDQIIESA